MFERPKSLLEQVVEGLREGALAGRWGSGLPGLGALAKEHGVAEGTVRRAVRLLEKEGVLAHAGAGRRRQVVGGPAAGRGGPARSLRVAVLLRDDLANEDAGFRWIMATVQSRVEAKGHRMVLLRKTQADFQFDDSRVIRMLRRETADLWIAVGCSRVVLEWLTSQGRKTFAFGGGCFGLPEVAATGSLTQPALLVTVRRLCSLGHRRIVFLMPHFVRQVEGKQSKIVQMILEELAVHGITGGAYHVPDFDETPEGLRERLDALFRITPPTAIFATYPGWLFGVLSYLAARGLKVPRDVSVICGNDASGFAWTQPRVAHFQHDDERMARRMVNWVERWSQGRRDFKQEFAPVKLIEEGSIGPAKG